MRRRKGQASGTKVVGSKAPTKLKPFADGDEMLESARQMFHARSKLHELDEDDDVSDFAEATKQAQCWNTFWHDSFSKTGPRFEFIASSLKAKLTKLEREILVALVLERLALLPVTFNDCSEVLSFLNVPSKQMVSAMRSMSVTGTLYLEKFISYDDEDEDLRDRSLLVDPSLVDSLLFKSGHSQSGWEVNSEKQMFEKLRPLVVALEKRSGTIQNICSGYGSTSELFKLNRKVKRLNSTYEKTLEEHHDWKVALFNHNHLDFVTRDMVTALIGKELGYYDADHDLFLGRGLACAGATSVEEKNTHLDTLALAIRNNLIQPCGGDADVLTDDRKALEEAEFELTPNTLDLLGLNKSFNKKRDGSAPVREAVLSMDQVVLSGKVSKALEMAVVQSKHAKVLLDNWGMAKAIPYGRAMTLLFSGPPGVGKTASAEALAHKLGKPILVADYTEVVNCFVGNTEKNIAKNFRDAVKHDAVLFWDEADSLIYDRESASKSWEVSGINTMLKEIEKFSGVCILATNRKVHLDSALERRIAIKVQFERPDREMRNRIWTTIIPDRLPLAKDVSVEGLSKFDLSGGEIKNVILNAARQALMRGPKARIKQNDFLSAITMEEEGRLQPDNGKRMGFQ